MPEPNWNVIAQSAYDAYRYVVRSDSQPLPVPEFEELPPRYQEGWREAVKTACEALTEAEKT